MIYIRSENLGTDGLNNILHRVFSARWRIDKTCRNHSATSHYNLVVKELFLKLLKKKVVSKTTSSCGD